MDSSRIGAGMISRGEVALIIINIGIANQILSENLISPLIIVVILTTIVTPILLSRLYANKKEVLLKLKRINLNKLIPFKYL